MSSRGHRQLVSQVAGADPDLDRQLSEHLDVFNHAATPGVAPARELTVQLRDDAGELVGGVSGWTWGLAGGMGLVWVRPDSRGSGVGSLLLRDFEGEAVSRGCTHVFVTSFTFQAPAFYERHGYRRISRWEGVPTQEHADVHLRKDLVQQPPPRLPTPTYRQIGQTHPGPAGIQQHGAMTDPALTTQLANFERVVLQRDAELAASVLHPDYALVLVIPVPAVIPRDRWLEVLPDYQVEAYEVQAQQLHVFGSCATLMQSLQMTATVLGEDRSGGFVISDVWLRGDDGWRIWRRHSTPLTAGAMPGAS